MFSHFRSLAGSCIAPLVFAAVLSGCAAPRVQVEGTELGVPGQPLMVVATGEPGGGSYRWRSLCPDFSRVIVQQGGRAFVVQDMAGLPAIFEVTYRRRLRSCTGYFVPCVGDVNLVAAFSWTPDTPEEKAEREKWHRMRDEHVARMKTPEGLAELRGAIGIVFEDSGEEPEQYVAHVSIEGAIGGTRWSIVSVGRPAAVELHKLLTRTEDGGRRAEIIETIFYADKRVALVDVFPELVRSGDIAGAACMLAQVGSAYELTLSDDMVEGLLKGLESDNGYIRMRTCRCIGEARLKKAAPELARLQDEDPREDVRKTALVALKYLTAPEKKWAWLKEVPPEWPRPYGDLQEREPDPRDVARARTQYPEVSRQIAANWRAVFEPPVLRFRLLAWAMRPVLKERLEEEDCNAEERRAIQYMLKPLE